MRLWPERVPDPPRTRAARIYRPLTAAATQVGPRNSEQLQRLIQPWQQRALADYDSCGECWYPAQGYARSLERIRFFPGILDDRGEIEEVDSGPLAELFDRIQDPGGGRTELQGAYGRLMFLIGDGRLVVTQQDEREVWEYLSPAELRIVPGAYDPVQYLRFRAPGLAPEELQDAPDDAFEPLPDEARVWRLWRRHPTYTELSDSPVKGVLELYDLLQWLTLAASASAANRAATKGLFFLPDELTFGQNDVREPDEDPQNDPLMQEILEGISKSIRNPGTAEAASPWFLRGPGLLAHPDGAGASHMKDLMGWMQMGPEVNYSELEACTQVIQRIANGLDLPVDWVTGNTGDVNHWSGWLVDEQGFRMHIAPVADRFARDLSAAYLRPAALAAGIPDAERVAIGYDPAAAINHPDEIKTAREAFRDGAVSLEYYLDKIGASQDQAATDEDRGWILALMGKVAAEPEAEGEVAPQDGGRGGDVEAGEPEQNGNQPISASALQANRILTALDLAVEGARYRAGSRLRTRTQGCSDCRVMIDGVEAGAVAATLGRELVLEQLDGKGDEHALVAGAAGEFTRSATKWGVPADIAIELGRLAEQHALRTLYESEPPPLPAGVQAVVLKAIR